MDLETLVCGGGGSDSKIACETLAEADPPSEEPDQPEVPPDFPPESFWLSKDAELDWFDRNAFYERKDSTKGNSTSVSSNTTANVNSNSSSQRFSLNRKSKASIIGLPKPQKSTYADGKGRRNCRTANTRLFPKRSEPSTGKSAVPVTEPSSPKVSCMGRVRSKKDRNRRWRNRHRTHEPATVKKTKPPRDQKTGFWTNFRSIFRTRCRHNPPYEVDGPLAESPPRRSGVTAAARESQSTVEPPGLGGMKRFVSGRRSESWSVDEGDEVAEKSESLDRDSVWRRRAVDPPKEVHCSRDWESAGPASV